MTKRKKWILGSILVASVAGLGGWASLVRGREAEPVFTVEVVKRQDLRESVTANGEIQAKTKVNVGTSVTGEIKELRVRDGQEVRAGDLLVVIDQERYKQDLNRAELGLRMAKQDLENAEATYQRQQAGHQRQEALHRQGLISLDAYQDIKLTRDNAEISLQRAKVAVQQAQSQVALAQDALDKTMIRASMSGRVTGLKSEKGEMAVAGQTNIASAVLMVISDMTEILMEMKVGELDVVKLREGQPAEIQVDAVPGKVFQGKVLTVATSSDRGQATGMPGGNDAQNYKVRLQLLGSPAELSVLRPGMSARAAVLSKELKDVLAVPLAAALAREARAGGLGLMAKTRTAVVVVKEGRAEERTPTGGAATRRALEVREGIKQGEEVITGPIKALASLRPGDPVRLAPKAAK